MKRLVALTAALTLLAGCSGTPNRSYDDLLVNGLPPCPSSPNCLRSDDPSEQHRTSMLQLTGDWQTQRAGIIDAAQELPRTALVDDYPEYLRFVATSKMMRYKDDLELLHRGDGQVQIRSASRVGYRDFGVNAERIEQLTGHLKARGLIQ
ncbi:MAG: DUF1499 domain-containing protein [Marinobacter sp.]|nr:DUF1499 domain-containing protein [Marinobacter sp.]